MSEPKDNWDKLEIVGKVALPFIIGAATLYFNGQLNQRQRDASMVDIAVGVVSEDPSELRNDSALRDWAIERLVIHGDLTEAAANELRLTSLPNSIVALEFEKLRLEQQLHQIECRNLYRELEVLERSLRFKERVGGSEAILNSERIVTKTDMAFDQAEIASAQAQLLLRDCPSESTTALATYRDTFSQNPTEIETDSLTNPFAETAVEKVGNEGDR